MDSKITMSFDTTTIEMAKAYADAHGISLSRLTEILFRRLTSNGGYARLEDFPVSDWANQLAEGEIAYIRAPRSNKALRAEHHQAKKKKA
jgi:hypothetical protein